MPISRQDILTVKRAVSSLKDSGNLYFQETTKNEIFRFIDAVEQQLFSAAWQCAPLVPPPKAPYPTPFPKLPEVESPEVIGLQSALRLQRVFTCQSDEREATALRNYAGVKLELATLHKQIASAISRGDLKETFYKDLPK